MPRGVQWDDLPKSVKDRIHDSRREKIAREAPLLPGQRLWQCCACGVLLRSYAAVERHIDTEGHRRVECVLKVDASPG